jgi:Secretion system C-terminal sorting domain
MAASNPVPFSSLKVMKKKTYFLLAFAFLVTAAKAEFIQPFLHESFGGNGFPSAWSTGDASGQGVVWQHCTNPLDCPPASTSAIFCSDPLFRSPGFNDGYMFVNSFGAGVLTTPSQSYLRTAQLDCSSKNAVFLRFYTYINAQYFSPDVNAIVRVKSGNGAWSEFTVFPNMNLDMVSNLNGFNSQLVQLDISDAAALKSNVTIEWYWKTNYDIAWMIDDVALYDQDPMEENVVWGVEQYQGTFSGGFTGWSVLNNQYDSCHWIWVDSAMLHLANDEKRADALACWSGVYDGAMLMNASFCARYGNPNEPRSRSDLQSPAIDLTDEAPGTQLYLRFNQAFDLGNIATPVLPVTSIAISINNGLSFIDTINANPLSQFSHAECEETIIPLPIEVAGKPQVRLRFIFSGDTHFWMVDDIRITQSYDYDLELNKAFYNVAPDFEVPSTQVAPIRLYAQVKNSGLLPSIGTTAHVAVYNSLNEKVFEDSLQLNTIQPSNEWAEVYFSKKFSPAAHPEDYMVYYWVSANDLDQNPSNNRAYFRYKVSEGVFSKNQFCKASFNYFFPTIDKAYEIGNCYYVPKGSKLKAESMSFAFDDLNGKLTGTHPALLQINLYRWSKDGLNGDVNGDTIANMNEFERVAINNYEMDGSDNHKVVTVPISDEGDTILLEDDTYYFVTVAYLDPVIFNGEQMRFPIAASEEINYTAMFYNSYFDTLPAYVSMLREGDEEDFRANAWALRRIPFVNLNVSEFVNPTGEVLGGSKGFLRLSPNPTSDFVWVTAEIPIAHQPISLEIFDLCGRKVLERHFESENVSQLPILVSELSNGSYTVRVACNEVVLTQKLMVIH